jgi:hypothetical protein
MKKEVCLMCIVCFFLGYFICDVIGKCGFGREHMSQLCDEDDSKVNTLGCDGRMPGGSSPSNMR